MATKINESVWGTVPESGHALRLAPNSLGTCYNNGTFDPDNINAMDKSVVPWGVPYCGIGGMSYLKKLRMPIPIEGSNNKKAGTLTTFDIEEFVGTNNPIALMITGNINDASDENWFTHRMSGAVNSSSTAFTSNAAFDRDTNLPAGSYTQYMWTWKPIVYLDYQKVMVQVQKIILWDKASGNRVVTGNLSGYPASDKTWDDYELLGFQYEIYYRSDYNTWITSGYYTPIPVNEKDTSKYVLDRYFGQEVRPQKWTPYTYCAEIKTTFYGSSGGYTISSTAITTEADSESLNDENNWTSELQSYGNYINGSQTFDNVSYTMEKKCGFMVSDTWFEIPKGSEMPGSDYYPKNIQMGVYYKIKDYEPGTSKADAWTKIIAHEIAFLGLPFQIKINDDAGTPAATASIADDDVFLPIFDTQHMVTTGRYTTDIAVKQAQINYTWNNIFEDTVPDWDSTYNPPKPSGGDGDGDENDSGQLNNSLYRNIRLGGSNYFYALSETELHNFINFVNGMYINESDDTKLKLDFKGSNPNDYIVGVYAYPFNIPNTPHESNIYIGCVESTVNANVVRQTDTGYFTFGTLVVEPYYNDFRDYAPYTQIEIYIPLCGTVELDTAFYMGHTITVDGIYDINTGALTVRILRDNEIDRTFDGSIAVQIPVTARNMGEYQNNIHQLRMNLINAAVSGVTAGEKAITGGIASAMQSYGANNPMSAMSESSLDIGATAYMSGQNISNAKYNLSHTQPRVSVTSTASSANAFQMYNKAILFIKRAKMLDNFDSEKYGKTIGYACLMNKQLSEVSGFTVCANADLSGIPATADEINAIQAALQSGIYL